MTRPRIGITMGDMNGIGPEVVARAVAECDVRDAYDITVVGDVRVLERAIKLVGADLEVVVGEPAGGSNASSSTVRCWNPVEAAFELRPGQLDGRAGRAAYDFLVAATRATLAGQFDAIVTAPLSKAALHLGGLDYPGHTEILAELCGVERFAMMLYLPHSERVASPRGLGVAHVTLHTSIASVPGLLSAKGIKEKIELLDGFMRQVGCAAPRITVCALNPHAGEEGLFGDEESRVIAPAVAESRDKGINAVGPLPADTLLRRAIGGEFDGVVAMYHDQGHIAFKLVGQDKAVNVTLGLPIVRTSPSHGTAFDIAWRGVASAGGMREAMRVAALLAEHRAARDVRSALRASP